MRTIIIIREMNTPLIKCVLKSEGINYWDSTNGTILIKEEDHPELFKKEDDAYVSIIDHESFCDVLSLDYKMHPITRDQVMGCTQHHDNFPFTPYICTIDGNSYCFKDTDQIIPFIERELGMYVVDK